MSALELGLWSFPVLLALIFLRVPIGLAMLLVGLGGHWLVRGDFGPILAQLKDLTFSTFSSHALSIVPLFLLMGQFAALGGLSAALFKAAGAWLGHRRGGLAMASIGACAGFGAVCGSSLATAATMGQVALPELRRAGYSPALSTGTLAAGGTLGILIPPSMVLVIYAVIAEQNVAHLFAAALVPGLIAVLGYMGAIAVYVRLRPDAAGVGPRVGYRRRVAALVPVWPVLAIFGAVMGGIYFGWFTPTEAAAVGAVGTGLVAWANGGLTRAGLMRAMLGTASATAMIFLILLGAMVFNSFLALSQLPQQVAALIGAQGLDPWLILAAMLLFYLVLGCVMDSLSMILLTVPIFLPIVSGLDYGLSPVEFGLWFGILVLIVVETGMITPPVGLNLFVINAMDRSVPMTATWRGVLPFVATDIVRLALLAAFPVLALGLVRLIA